MKRSGRFELWAGGTTAALCLLLLNILVWQMRHDPARESTGEPAGKTAAIIRHLPAPMSPRLHPNEAALTPVVAKEEVPQVPDRPFKSKRVERSAALPPAKADVESAASPQPKTTTVEPLGYVVKASGQVEAIISLADNVQLVHVGDSYGEKYKVAKISPSAVELVEKSEPVLSAQSMEGDAPDSRPPAAPKVIASNKMTRDTDAGSAPNAPQPPPQNELGYVEKMDGKVEAIMAEGDNVRLVEKAKSFAREFHDTAPSLAKVEPSGAPPQLVVEQASLKNPEPDPGHAGDASAVASQAESEGYSAALRPEAAKPGNDDAAAQALATLQPEEMADYAGGGFPAPSPAAALMATPLPAPPALPSEGSVKSSPVRILGYVETADGKTKAILDVFDEVQVASSGDLLADRYRVTEATPSSIEVVEETMAGIPPPARPSPAVERGDKPEGLAKTDAVEACAGRMPGEISTAPALLAPRDNALIKQLLVSIVPDEAVGADAPSAARKLAAGGSALGQSAAAAAPSAQGIGSANGSAQAGTAVAGWSGTTRSPHASGGL